MTQTVKIKATRAQYGFFKSKKRYPAFVAGIASGKTYFGLLKVWNACQEYPNSLWMIVRKEFTDLRDSTMKDFFTYFSVTVDANKEYKFSNGSVIMFRHGAEYNVLKNINLSGFLMEQGEEFDSVEAFNFLRGRLRRNTSTFRQGILIANVNGHNWIYDRWKANQGMDQDYDLYESGTFDNKKNLPSDFVSDLKKMESESPNHYRRYVLNDWDEEAGIDVLIKRSQVEACYGIPVNNLSGGGVLAVDPARYGDCETVFTVFRRGGPSLYKQTKLLAFKERSLMEVVGFVRSLIDEESYINVLVIDVNGLGGGVVDRLLELQELASENDKLKKIQIIPYNGGERSDIDPKKFQNRRSQDYWKLKDSIANGHLVLMKDSLQETQLSNLPFKYYSGGQRHLLTKEEMRAKKIVSPDRADGVVMANSVIEMCDDCEFYGSTEQKRANDFWDRVHKDIEHSDEEAWHVAQV